MTMVKVQQQPSGSYVMISSVLDRQLTGDAKLQTQQ